jgi:hypothetical protein
LRLRKKLGSLDERLETVWGIGYRFARAGDQRSQPSAADRPRQ